MTRRATVLRTVSAAAGDYAALRCTGELSPIFLALGIINALALACGAWVGNPQRN